MSELVDAGRPPLGIYVHIPFCRRKCGYCDFLSFPATAVTQTEYVAALRREIELAARRPEIAGRRVATLYIGGGTPTVLPVADLAGIVDLCLRSFAFGDADSVAAREVTVEANPGTVTEADLSILRASGVNRLSLGVQALDDRLLKAIGRIHDVAAAKAAVTAARAAGFTNLNLDLMFALPGQTITDWQRTLDQAIALAPEHISAYSLIIEEGTPFCERAQRGDLERPDEDTEAEMYRLAIARLTAAGYRHYEISNFARPGFESRHNLVYWHNDEYLGLGLGAWSCLRGSARSGEGYIRDAVTRDLATYCSALAAGVPPERSVAEPPSRRIDLSETAMMALRLTEGISESAFRARFGCAIDAAFPGVVDRLIGAGLVERSDAHVRLTRQGLLLANQAFAAFVGNDMI